jgi:Fic family protein
MPDQNWDIVKGPAADEIQVLNYANTINVIKAMVKLLTYRAPPGPNGCPAALTNGALKELHRTGTLYLLSKPGDYRTENVDVQLADGRVVFKPPPWEDVDRHMQAFEATIKTMWPTAEPLDLAAYALWRINWIHPFKNGNGRTARAFCYACLCLKYGFILPGERTVIDLIMADRRTYEDVLAHADKALAESGQADLAPMKAFLEGLLTEQLRSAPLAP